MPYIPGFDRNQMMMCSWDSFVEPDSIARLIDAFVDSLDLSDYGVKEMSLEGRPAYNPKSMYKLYIYGNRKGIRSSRRLAESCRVNLEVKWMMGGVEPDFRTVSDFRKDNIGSLKGIFHEFNRRISGAVEWGFTSIDGSKFSANNSKNANFTKNKLDDRIQWLNAHTDEYLRILQEMDEQEDVEEKQEKEERDAMREEIREKLSEAQDRLSLYKAYQKRMEKEGMSQLSLTDPDSRLMKSKNGFLMAFNPQTAVDSETHLIRDYVMTNQVTDHGMLLPTMEGIREETEGQILETVADKGYEKEEDMIGCLENGIIPHVILNDGKDVCELELAYEEAEDADTKSTDPEEIKKCLHAGKMPEVYEGVIDEIGVKEVRRKVKEKKEKTEKPGSIYGTQEEMMARAREGYYVRDPERNLVYCPAGQILRQKSIKKNGNIRYANKLACRNCPHRNQCYKGKNMWKEIDFSKDCLEKPCREWLAASGKKEAPAAEKKEKIRYEKRKVVKLTFRPDKGKMAERMCLSEHPFGTIKRAMGAGYFLLRGMKKVAGEFALFCLGYNFERAKNLLGFDKMMELMAAA